MKKNCVNQLKVTLWFGQKISKLHLTKYIDYESTTT